MSHEALGDRLGALRLGLRLNQSQWAKLLGVSQSYVHHVEAGTRAASLGMVEAVAKQMPEVDLRWLVLGTGSPPDNIKSHSHTEPKQKAKPQGQDPAHSDPLHAELAELRAISQRGNQATLWRIVVALRGEEQPVSRDTLAAQLKMDPGQLATDLAILKRSHLVHETASGWMATSPDIHATGPADFAQLALTAVDVLLGNVLPAVEDGAGSLILTTCDISADRLPALMRDLSDMMRTRLEAEEPGPELATVVFGLCKL